MKLKKIILAAAVGLSLFALTACTSSKGNIDKNVVTMKGDTIREGDVYDEAIKYPTVGISQLVQNMTFSKIFEEDLGKTVTTKEVTAEFDKTKTQYGDNLDTYLQQQGLTQDTYKETIRLNLLQKAAIDKDIKATQYTDDAIKAAWATYYPEVDTYVYSSASKDEAQKIHDQAASDFDGFKKTADSSGYEQKFDSSNTSLPQEVRDAAVKLTDGQSSDVITSQDESTSTPMYYFVYMIKNPGKNDADMSKYKKQIENYIKVTKENDSTYTAGVIKGYLTKHNVTVKEKALSNIFSSFTATN
ncbi:peptidyl-prolyl cis-trans isomerase [Lactovum odontotermitis]